MEARSTRPDRDMKPLTERGSKTKVIGMEMLTKGRTFTVTDGKIVLLVQEAEEGGYVVTAPFCPGLVTEAETLGEAFANARDAMKALSAARSKRRARGQRVAAG